MGGKDKKGPRTKGNVKPSSSGRSAELLGFVPEFVGFSGLPEGSIVPAVMGSSSLLEDATTDLSIPADFRLTLRKMGKRDSITKIKALQEFYELCEQNSVETLKGVLPFWPRIFTRLAVDADRRVREYLHKSHFLFSTKLGRNLAPFLKEIMGAWFTSQCDTYAPAASLATQSLTKCFPGNKLTEAVVFCYNDVIIYINDSLFKEDNYSEEQRERIRIGGIAGYSLLLEQLKSKTLDNEKVSEHHHELWKNSKTYKLVEKGSSLSIKQAWFGMIYSLVNCLPKPAKENSSRILASISAFLNDPESASQPSLWETVLKLLFFYSEDEPNFPHFLSQISPRFIDLLQKACSGNARKFGPLVVPLVRFLRNYIREKATEAHKFDEEVVAALLQGLLSRNVSNSSIEASALSAILFQLLDFVFDVTKDSGHISQIFLKQVIPLIEALMRQNESTLTAVVRHLTKYLDSLFRQEEEIAGIVWEKLENFIVGSLSQSPHPEPEVNEKFGLVILILMDAESKLNNRRKLVKRSARLRFEDSLAIENSTEEPKGQLPEMSAALRLRVAEMSVLLCKTALQCCEIRDCSSCLCFLISLTSYEYLASKFVSVESEGNLLNSIKTIFIQSPNQNTSTLFFIVMDTVQNGHEIFDSFSERGDLFQTLVITAFENPDIFSKQSVLRWLRGHRVANLLTTVANHSLNTEEDGELYWKLLRAVLCARLPNLAKGDLEPVVSNDLIDAIIEVLIQNLNVESMEDSIDAFTLKLYTTIKSIPDFELIVQPTSKWVDDLIEVLSFSSRIGPDSFNILLDLWQIAAWKAIHSRCDSAINIIKRSLHGNPDFVLAQRLIDILDRVLGSEISFKNQEESQTSIHRILLDHREWMSWVNDSNSYDLLAKEITTGRYCHVASLKKMFQPVNFNSWSGLLKTTYVISSIATRYEMSSPIQNEFIPYVLYANAVADILVDLNKNQSTHFDFKELEIMAAGIDSNAKSLLLRCSASQQMAILSHLIEKSSQLKWIWCYAAKMVHLLQVDSVVDQGHLECFENLPVLLPSLFNIDMLNKHARLQTEKLLSFSQDSFMESFEVIAANRVLLEQLNQDVDTVTLECVSVSVRTLHSWQSRHNEHFLFGVDLKEAGRKGSSVQNNCVWTVIETIRFLSTVVERYPQQVESSSWDFILCSMSSWCTTLEESWSRISSKQLNDPVLLSFTIALCNLIDNCGRLIAKVERKSEETFISSIPSNLVSEWNDVFSEAAYNAVLPLFLQISRSNDLLNALPVYLLETLSLSIRHIPAKNLTSYSQLSVDCLSLLLLAEQSSIQFSVHGLIAKMLPGIASKEAESSREETDNDQHNNERPPPRALLFPIEQASFEVLEDVRRGDLHLVEAHSKESTQILGFLLGWDLVLQLCGCSGSELRCQYALFLGNSKLISRLMDGLFCIIPHVSMQQQVDLDFEFRADLSLNAKAIQDIAVKVYSSALRYLPAVVRRWCNNADKRTATFVEKFTARCVSPVLSALDLQYCCKTWDNMTVRVRPNAREVVATYKLNEEGSMELVMQLPTNYPLGNIVVETGKKVGVTSNQWRSWILQLQTFLMQQNGSILEGLTLWKQNVDKRFEGIEECYICYYVLHGSNYQLPKLSCRTCRKKFHSNCLYQWFSTSNNSTCPLCRNLF